HAAVLDQILAITLLATVHKSLLKQRWLYCITNLSIGKHSPKNNYPAQNEIELIENPAQAWNAITIGAFTEKTAINDPSFAGWETLAPDGELCPTSRTSISWERQWPVKPDILMEGGNWATSETGQHPERTATALMT
ncbi:MAG: S8 family serine peptidase, partial [Terracidiphilus sp.]